MKKIGILGGTFDPPHIGHLMIAEEVYDALGLDQVWFIPSNEPPHKRKSQTAAIYRRKMVEAAIEDNDHFEINTIELEREGKSFTIDTIKRLREAYPTTDFYFIIGADMVEYLPKWAYIEELIRLVQFVGVKRADFTMKSPYPIIEVTIPTFEVSSTMLRDRLTKNATTKYLLPDRVQDMIKEYRLYGC